MSSLRLTRIELQNWKNFISADVPLARRVFIVGPNATGKSNLLDVFRFLRDLVLEGGGLSKAVELRGGLSAVRSLHARQVSTIRVAATLKDEAGDGWIYELEFNHESPKRPRPLVRAERVSRLSASGKTEVVLTRPDADDKSDPERLTQTAIQQVNLNQDFREVAESLRSIAYLHLVPQLLREEQASRADILGIDPFGRDLLDRIRNTSPRSQRARLKRIEKVLKLVAPQLEELKLQVDDHGRPHLEAKFQHWRPGGAFQNETQFSDGTLRLIGLLWSLQEPAGPLLLEEPELSLHTAIVRRLAPFIHRAQQAARGRQVILSTHSEHLLGDEGISPEEILLVQPAREGSEIVPAASQQRIQKLMQSGLRASEAVLPETEMEQFEFFASAAA